ncbi:DUF1349 domain-containing protein [uncultured Acetobacteroides sp.]|uniref:DUF1349 domain-containing protein n=1 Tax=uncultured Acetobacteroides sp. TaxID=1760811 RepID=UPI0029F4F508|nr:DUF1349 domain-containing protein [uncultured Acetobacteroides sp.]
MKLVLFALLGAAMTMSSFKAADQQPGEACQVKLPGITFTRSLNNAAKLYTFENGTLTIKSDAKKDYFNDPSNGSVVGTSPILLTPVDNSRPFTLTAKVTPAFNETYDAGVLYIYSTGKLWQKLCFEKDEYKRTRVVSVRTIGTSDDNNHDILTDKSVYLRITSDSKTVGLYYSLDKVTWNLVKVYKNNYPKKIWVGLSTQSPIGNGTIATFEDFSLTYSSIKNFRLGI